jgi:hypothetical protein
VVFDKLVEVLVYGAAASGSRTRRVQHRRCAVAATSGSGSVSATITLGVYSHLWPTAEDRTRAAAGALVAAALADPADSLRTEAH